MNLYIFHSICVIGDVLSDATTKGSGNWANKEAATHIPSVMSLSVAASGIPAVQVTAPCDSPASMSPAQPSSEGKATANGHHNSCSPVQQQQHGYHQRGALPGAGDVNENVTEHHHKMPSNLSTSHHGHQKHSGESMRISPSASSAAPSVHPLFLFGICRWPGCESPCDDITTFIE